MQYEIDAPANDIIAMNLTMAALTRWLAIAPADDGGEVGKQIGAIYREIRLVLDEFSAELPGDDEEDEEDEDDEVVDVERIAIVR